MAVNLTQRKSPLLSGITDRYPDKTCFLAQVFNDTTNSYKIVWFLAILDLIKRRETNIIPVLDIFEEMAVVAWHPVCLYRLSLGRQDKLQDVVIELQRQSGLPPQAASESIRAFVGGSATARSALEYLKRYVPTRFLAPWVAGYVDGAHTHKKRVQLTIEFAKRSQTTHSACLYSFEGFNIRINESWRVFLEENMGIVQSFAEHHFTLYLQARNANIPGIVNKLHAPVQRDLTVARRFWRLVRDDLTRNGNGANFCDIYSQRLLGENFSVDHFLPWSFVVHDLMWNLIPVERPTNSSKNDALPDLEIYLPRLANLQFIAIQALKMRPKLLEDYTDCFKKVPSDLIAIGENGLFEKYKEVVIPQAQIASNLGFKSGWKLYP